ncbi:MAG: N-acetyl-gamma-glutamyl-phosphate reductase [Ruminococcaceae bacterium]|nr:N-acetyl-gamma-glutamyl-phosphate reductase [Oscillospiraceae bacterium]
MTKVFIDGSAGTTGLRINERLSDRSDIELIKLPEELRKDINARKEALNSADIAFLCLPDAAAIEAVSLVDNPNTAIIDTSTAHRTNPCWTYGFPELLDSYDAVKKSKRIANPGCHASGFVALIKPLVDAGLISSDKLLHCFSLTGYSGGGKKMIAEYESAERPALYDAPRQYGISQSHKHLPEMAKISGLSCLPLFCPIVAPFYSGMEVTVTLGAGDLNISGDAIKRIADVYTNVYNTGRGLVKFVEEASEDGFMSACAFSGRDDMQITVSGNEERIILVSRFDNLGKGASGSALQNMNILLGACETEGLNVGN